MSTTVNYVLLLWVLMPLPALLTGSILFGIYLWLRHQGISLRKKIVLLISQVILFYLCSLIILIFDKERVMSTVVRPLLEVVGLDGFSSFFFAGQFFALLISVLLLEIFRNRISR